MNKTAIKNFAIWARNKLIADICYRAGLMGITEKGIADALPQSTREAEFYDFGATEPYMLDGDAIKLTPIEYNILLLLVKNAGKVFSIDEIYEQIWNEEAIGADNTVAVHIRHIREKIEINPREPKYLKVVWGVGYKIEKQ